MSHMHMGVHTHTISGNTPSHVHTRRKTHQVIESESTGGAQLQLHKAELISRLPVYSVCSKEVSSRRQAFLSAVLTAG